MTVDSFPFIRMSDPTAIKSLPPLFKSKAAIIEQDAVGVKWITVRPVYRNILGSGTCRRYWKARPLHPGEDSLPYVAGYCTFNDFSQRGYQMDRGGQ